MRLISSLSAGLPGTIGRRFAFGRLDRLVTLIESKAAFLRRGAVATKAIIGQDRSNVAVVFDIRRAPDANVPSRIEARTNFREVGFISQSVAGKVQLRVGLYSSSGAARLRGDFELPSSLARMRRRLWGVAYPRQIPWTISPCTSVSRYCRP